MWFIGVEVEQESNAPPPKKNPGSAPVCSTSNVTNGKSQAIREQGIFSYIQGLLVLS